jgi:hypothetical protein
MYINSPGTNAPNGQAYSYDTEAFAIAVTMQVKFPPPFSLSLLFPLSLQQTIHKLYVLNFIYFKKHFQKGEIF